MGHSDAEQGSGTVLAAGVGLVLVICLSMVLLLAQASVMAGRVASAADLAALAAADAWRGLAPGEPCAVAGEVAARHNAELLECVPAADGSVQITVQLNVTGIAGPAAATSRAGPPPPERG